MNFTFSSFGLRFLFSAILVFATYNPEGFSFYHWITPSLPSISVEQAFIGVVLIIGWVIYLRATLRSLGIIGLVLAGLFFGRSRCSIHRWFLLLLGSECTMSI